MANVDRLTTSRNSLREFKLWTHAGVSGGGKLFTRAPLFLNDMSAIKFQYSHEYTYPLEDALAKTGNTGKKILSLINQMEGVSDVLKDGDTIQGSLVENSSKITVPSYRKLPAWKTTNNITLPSTLTFVFQYGYLNQFSGLTEVMNPITELAAIFALSEVTAGYDNHSAGTLKNLPLPLSGKMIASIAKFMIKGAENPDGGGDGAGPPPSIPSAGEAAEKGMLDEVFQKASELVEKFNTSVTSTYSSGQYSAICRGQLGGINIPPFIVKGVSWDFDFSQIDDQGYPYRGTISLNDCMSIEMASQSLIKSFQG